MTVQENLTMNKRPYLQHYVIEIFGLNKDILQNINLLIKCTNVFMRLLKLKRITEIHHEFNPGITLVFILSSSHISLHTWPENNYLHIDFLSCQKLSKTILKQLIQKVFKPQRLLVYKIDYG